MAGKGKAAIKNRRPSIVLCRCKDFKEGRQKIGKLIPKPYSGLFLVYLRATMITGRLWPFHNDSSTSAQRVWTMSWLAFAFVLGGDIP